MIRVITQPGEIEVGRTVRLEESEAHHLEVRRVREGSKVELLDCQGGIGTGPVRRDAAGWSLEVEMAMLAPKPADTILAVGAGDRDRFLLVAEKAVELGASQVIPVATSQVPGVATRVRPGTVERARRRVREACKQSGNAWMPLVTEITDLESLAGEHHSLRWLLADAEGDPCGTIGVHESIGWLIGPEAGFALADIDIIDSILRPEPVRLAESTLRFETAAIAALAVTQLRRFDSFHKRS